MPTLTGVHHVALTVTDVDRSVPWYERVLGFSTIGREDQGEAGMRKVFLRGPGFGITLTLVQHPVYQAKTQLLVQINKQQGLGSMDKNFLGSMMPDVGGFSTPLPPAAEQDQIVAFIREETRRIDALVAKVEHLSKG